MRTFRNEFAREFKIRQALRADGDLNQLISAKTRGVIAHYYIALMFAPEQPRWKRAGGGRYEWKSAHGTFTVEKWHHDVWLVRRDDGGFLLHHDGRGALFMGRYEAETAAVMHARDGTNGSLNVDDGLRWEEEDDFEDYR